MNIIRKIAHPISISTFRNRVLVAGEEDVHFVCYD